MTLTYLRPTGFLPFPMQARTGSARGASLRAPAGAPTEGDRAEAALPYCGLPVAGQERLFTAAEVIERDGERVVRSGPQPLSEIAEGSTRSAWSSQSIAERLDAIVRHRPPLRGLAMDRPQIMGIVNVTPDSFSDGGQFDGPAAAISHARRLVDEGATMIDIGGESTRPGSEPITIEEECARVLPVIQALAGSTDALISIDTRNAAVMRAAVEAGADIINDVSALTYDPEAIEVVRQSGLPVILMHSLGDPRTMQKDPRYNDVLLDIFDYLSERIAACVDAGIPASRLVADPGIGFGKTLQHNLALLAGISLFHGLGVPVLLGASRKRFIGRISGVEAAGDRVDGSIGVALAAAGQGVQIFRVHDVGATSRALALWRAAETGWHEDDPLSA